MQPDLIYDIGFHVGRDTEFYLAKGFRVVAVEANPVLYAQGAEKFADAIAQGRLTLLNVGIAPNAGTAFFYVNDENDEWSSFDRAIAGRGGTRHHEVAVPTTTADALFARHGVPYFAKIDIEGYDHLVVQAVGRLQAKPSYLSVEDNGIHTLLELWAAGARRFNFVDQIEKWRIALPDPPLEGRWCAFTFGAQTSGPFGREVPGAWLGIHDAAHRYTTEIRPGGKLPGPNWWDIHVQFA